MVLDAMGVGLFGLAPATMAAIAAGLFVHLIASLLIGVVLTAALVGLSRYSDRFARVLFPSSRAREQPRDS